MTDTILSFLNQTNKTLPLDQRALNAWTAVLAARNQPGKSTDTTLRDAEYFLATYWAIQQPNPAKALATETAFLGALALYVDVKAVFDLTVPSLERSLRVTANPTSAPGGYDWALAGAGAGVLGRLSPDNWGLLPSNPVHPLPPTDANPPNLTSFKMGTFLGPLGANGLGTTQPLFLDPTPAGYSYHIFNSATEFKSVLLPIGTSLKAGFALLSFNGQVDQLQPGVVFDFIAHGATSGVDQFSISGLDASDGFDTPDDGRQFVLGLTFTDPADLAYIDVEPLVTPEPTTLLLWGTTLAGLGLAARRRRRRSGRT